MRKFKKYYFFQYIAHTDFRRLLHYDFYQRLFPSKYIGFDRAYFSIS